MSNAIADLLELFGALGQASLSPDEVASKLSARSDLTDKALRAAILGRQVTPAEAFSLLDITKALVTRHRMMYTRLSQSPELQQRGISASDLARTFFLNHPKPEFVDQFLGQPKHRHTALVSLVHFRDGSVWAIVAHLADATPTYFTVPVVAGASVRLFDEQLREYVSLLNSSSFVPTSLIGNILKMLGATLIPALAAIDQLANVVFLPHRVLHILPLHAVFSGPPETFYLDDLVASVEYGCCMEELLYGNWWPKGTKKTDSLQWLVVLDTEASELKWLQVELDHFRLLRSDGFPINLVTSPAQLPRNIYDYNLVNWSGHAKSDATAWGHGYARLGDLNVTARTIVDEWVMPRSPVVTLAACESAIDIALSEQVDEYCGLDMAWRIAGAGIVFGTLWRVQDPVAALWSISLSQILTKFPVTPSRALSMFQRDLRLGKWKSHMATPEQIAEAPTIPAWAKDGMLRTINAFSSFDATAFSNLREWAVFRCLI